MNTMELIRRRRSVRSYAGEALTAEETARLLAFAAAAENPYGLPIEYRILNAAEHGLTSPVISGTDTYIAGKLPRVPHAEEAFGYSFERFVLFAESLGVGTVWIAGTMNRDAFERAMELRKDEVLPCVSPLGRPAEKKSLRESMMRKAIKADSRLPFETLFFDGSFDRPLGEQTAGALRDALETVRWAPSAVNKQPWRAVKTENAVHFYEKRSKGYVSASGWDIQRIDMGIALCHFALGVQELGQTAKLRLADPGLPCPADTFYIATYLLNA